MKVRQKYVRAKIQSNLILINLEFFNYDLNKFYFYTILTTLFERKILDLLQNESSTEICEGKFNPI